MAEAGAAPGPSGHSGNNHSLGSFPDQPVFSNRDLGHQILWTCSQIALWPSLCRATMMQSLSYWYCYLYFPHANKEIQRGKWKAWGEFSLGRGRSSPAQISTSSSCFKCSPKQTKLPKMEKKEKKNRESQLNIGTQYLRSAFQLIMLLLYFVIWFLAHWLLTPFYW